MERYKIKIAYDGTMFSGSQRQVGVRTVQGVFEDALRKLKWIGNSILLAGRTDAGVHANGQVISFDLNWTHSIEDLHRALNALLPKDVSVRSVEVVELSFHPRFDAISRHYCFHLICQPVRNPLKERFAWRIWPAPNVSHMQLAAIETVGRKDFSAFGRATNPDGTTVRKVMAAQWLKNDDELVFEIVANAFLYHMVRRLVFFQVNIGQGKKKIIDLRHSLKQCKENHISGLAPAHGLILKRVNYLIENGTDLNK